MPELPSDNSMDKKDTEFDRLKHAVLSGSLTNFLDTNSVGITALNELLRTRPVLTSVENVLQVLWSDADIDAECPKAYSPIFYAAEYGTLEVVTLLIEKGAKIYERDNGWTPLHDAAQSNTKEVVLKIIESGVDVTAVAGRCGTALDCAKDNKEHGTAIAEILKPLITAEN